MKWISFLILFSHLAFGSVNQLLPGCLNGQYLQFQNGWTTCGAGGSAGITGPGSSVDNTIVRWDSTTGGIVQGTNIAISDNDLFSLTKVLPSAGNFIGHSYTYSFTGSTTTATQFVGFDLNLPPGGLTGSKGLYGYRATSTNSNSGNNIDSEFGNFVFQGLSYGNSGLAIGNMQRVLDGARSIGNLSLVRGGTTTSKAIGFQANVSKDSITTGNVVGVGSQLNSVQGATFNNLSPSDNGAFLADIGDTAYPTMTEQKGSVTVMRRFAPPTVTTTDATVTTVWSKTLSDNTSYMYTANCVANAAADRAMYQTPYAVYRTGAGAATAQTIITTNAFLAESDITWDASFDTSTNDVRLRVTGAVAKTIHWHCTVEEISGT